MDDHRYATVLIAVLKDPRDLQRAQEEGWYRIPAQHLPPRGSTARYLAFYQPRGTFGPEGGAVRYLARVAGWEMLRRRDLLPGEPDHPRADELYYRIRLGPLEQLPQPIRSGCWKRVTFIVTHWERLQQAGELRDLLHGSRWDECLWKALRRAQVLA
jgi:hypothetical protein